MDHDQLTPFHGHEVLHTARIIADLFEQQVEEHRYTQAHQQLREAARHLTDQMNDFYQLVASVTPG